MRAPVLSFLFVSKREYVILIGNSEEKRVF